MKRIARTTVCLVSLALSAGAAANPFSANLAKLTDSGRAEMFQRYMKTAKKECDAVTRVYFQGSTPPATDIWNIECDKSKSWTIRIDGNGKTQFFDCAKMTAGQKCWKPLATPAKRK